MKSEEYDLCIKYRRDYVSNLSGIFNFPELLVPLQKIAENLEFEAWFAGHYHVESQEGPVRIMFRDYEEL